MIKIFDDWKSILHTIAAFILTLCDPIALIAGTMIFIAYQFSEREKLSAKRGDFIEWLIGIILGSIIKLISPSFRL